MTPNPPALTPWRFSGRTAVLVAAALFTGSLSAGAKEANADTSNPAYASEVATPGDGSGLPAKAAGFIHPGILVNRAQLDEIRRRVAAGIEPQATALGALKSGPAGALEYTPHPRSVVECGSYSNPDLGCKDEVNDSEAAYGQALLWIVTGDPAYARNSIRIMNAWSATLRGGHTNANGPIQAAWAAEVWPRAAEIIRYTYKGWPDAEIADFQKMLRSQYLPSLVHGCTENGNKELAMSDALIDIGVFNDDRAMFDLGVRMWRARTPAYIYLKSDGPKPVEPPGGPKAVKGAVWINKGRMPALVDGILQETARDSQHPALALASMVGAAETARQQGLDLYSEEGRRIMAALEFQAQFLAPNHGVVPKNLEFNKHPTWEIAYNHFHDRLGNDLPFMAAVLPTIRPTGTNHMMAWETLTHAGMGSVGLPPVTAP